MNVLNEALMKKLRVLLLLFPVPVHEEYQETMSMRCSECSGSCYGDCTGDCAGGCESSCVDACEDNCSGTCEYSCDAECMDTSW